MDRADHGEPAADPGERQGPYAEGFVSRVDPAHVGDGERDPEKRDQAGKDETPEPTGGTRLWRRDGGTRRTK